MKRWKRTVMAAVLAVAALILLVSGRSRKTDEPEPTRWKWVQLAMPDGTVVAGEVEDAEAADGLIRVRVNAVTYITGAENAVLWR